MKFSSFRWIFLALHLKAGKVRNANKPAISMKTKLSKCFLMAIAVTPLLAGAICRADGPYHYITQIPIPGATRWDYLSIDPVAHRLYVSHGNEVVVIDLQNNQIVGAITNAPGVHGVAIAPDLGLGVTSNG